MRPKQDETAQMYLPQARTYAPQNEPQKISPQKYRMNTNDIEVRISQRRQHFLPAGFSSRETRRPADARAGQYRRQHRLFPL